MRAERHLLLDAVYVVCRHGVRIAAIVALTVGVAVVYDLAHPSSYTASVRLLVAPAGDGAAERDGRTARNQVEMLRDPGLVRRLLQTTGLAMPGAAFAADVSRSLRVNAVGDTDVIGLSLTWQDRVFAADLLNGIVAGYQRAILGADEAREGLRRAQGGLDDAQADLAAVEVRLGSARPGSDADGAHSERVRAEGALVAKRATADGVRLERALAQRKLDGIEAQFKSGGWVDGADAEEGSAGPAPLAQGFAVLLEKRQSLLTDGKADTPEMRAIDREIARVRTQSFATARQISAARVSALDDRLEQLGRGIADDEAALRALDLRESEGDVLRETRALKMSRVADERQRVESARQRVDVPWQGVGSVRVLSEAAPPAEPDWPSPYVLLRMAAGVGLGVGLISAAWSERRRVTIDRPDDISRGLGIDVMARLEDVPVARLR